MWKTLVAAVLLLAGCAGPADVDDGGPDATAADGLDDQEQAFGSLLVAVMTPHIVPIEGALVSVAGIEQETDSQGQAAFDALTPGAYVVEVREDTHGSSSAAVRVEAGQQARLTVKLVSTSIDAPASGSGPQQFHLNGFFDCSATYLIITGDCMTALDFVLVNATGACAPVCPGDYTNEVYYLDFPLHANWTTIVAEMHWEPGTTAGAKMTFAVEPAEWDAEGHAPKYARAAGGSPLILRLENGVPHATADASADGVTPGMPQAAGGEVLRTRSYVQGEAHNPGGTNFLGVGAAFDQEFDVLVTVFYGELAPEGFTAA